MKKTKHTEEKIIGAVKQLEAGRTAKELAREMSVSEQTLYNWKAKYGGMDVSDARRLRASLEEENPAAETDCGRSEPRQRRADHGDRKNGWSL